MTDAGNALGHERLTRFIDLLAVAQVAEPLLSARQLPHRLDARRDVWWRR